MNKAANCFKCKAEFPREESKLCDQCGALRFHFDVMSFADKWEFDERAEFQAGNVFVRPIFLKSRSAEVPAHGHRFDHVTIFVRGQLRYQFFNPETGEVIEEGIIDARERPAARLIPALVPHKFQAIDDEGAIGMCVFAIRDAEGIPCQEFTGNYLALG